MSLISRSSSVTVADYIADYLASKGCTHAFGLVGGANSILFHAISKRLTVVSVAHEQAAAMAAYWQSPTDAGSMPIHLLLYAQECVGRLAAEVSRLRAQLDEARDALQAIAQGGLPGQPLSLEQIARHALAQLDQARTERHDS